VRHLQQVLRARGAPINVTGNYLSETIKYIAEFQAGRGLRHDGVLDLSTLDTLVHLPNGPDGWDPRSDCVSLRQPTGDAAGSQGSCVSTLRARLATHGITVGRGPTFDADVVVAVRTFQQRAGLPPIGVADVGAQSRASRAGTVPPRRSAYALNATAVF
jgi:peptidoglycan hydrolase-like protein with peptidoglycan-binding domain